MERGIRTLGREEKPFLGNNQPVGSSITPTGLWPLLRALAGQMRPLILPGAPSSIRDYQLKAAEAMETASEKG
jgi:hypothetical protein